MAKGRTQDRTPNKVFTGVARKDENGDTVHDIKYNDSKGNRIERSMKIVMHAGKPVLRDI